TCHYMLFTSKLRKFDAGMGFRVELFALQRNFSSWLFGAAALMGVPSLNLWPRWHPARPSSLYFRHFVRLLHGCTRLSRARSHSYAGAASGSPRAARRRLHPGKDGG